MYTAVMYTNIITASEFDVSAITVGQTRCYHYYCIILVFIMSLRPISLLMLSLLRFADSTLPENSLWAWECHPLKLRLCLSQTL